MVERCHRCVSVDKNFFLTGLVCCDIFLTGEVDNAYVKKKTRTHFELIT